MFSPRRAQRIRRFLTGFSSLAKARVWLARFWKTVAAIRDRGSVGTGFSNRGRDHGSHLQEKHWPQHFLIRSCRMDWMYGCQCPFDQNIVDQNIGIANHGGGTVGRLFAFIGVHSWFKFGCGFAALGIHRILWLNSSGSYRTESLCSLRSLAANQNLPFSRNEAGSIVYTLCGKPFHETASHDFMRSRISAMCMSRSSAARLMVMSSRSSASRTREPRRSSIRSSGSRWRGSSVGRVGWCDGADWKSAVRTQVRHSGAGVTWDGS